MTRSTFLYVTIIRTTLGKLWDALTDPTFISQYWYGVKVECAWKKGARRLRTAGDRLPLRRAGLRA